MDRRKFMSLIGLGSMGLTLAPLVFAHGDRDEDEDENDNDDENGGPVLFPVPGHTGLVGHIVVVGGGMAGTTVAKYLRLWGGEGVEVTLIERRPSYVSSIMSNTVLNGQRSMADLNFNYDRLTEHYGVTRMQAEVEDIDTANRRVYHSAGAPLSYDRLVLAPGLEFDLMPGMTDLDEYAQRVPHAWSAGPQTQLLRDQLLALQNGDDVVMTIPLAPYRCPPGPYERACVIADWLKHNRPDSRVVVLDANPGIIVEQENFTHAFNVIHAGFIDYRPGTTVTDLDSANLAIRATRNGLSESLFAGVINPIPPQRAPRLLEAAGLLNSPDGRFAEVNVLSYESTKVAGVHVIGDASHTTQPKAGHIGNQQAKTCADAILRLLAGGQPDPAPVTNSACYTPITANTASWLSAVYQYDAKTRSMVIPARHNLGKPIAASGANTDNYKDMQVWFKTLMGDTFS